MDDHEGEATVGGGMQRGRDHAHARSDSLGDVELARALGAGVEVQELPRPSERDKGVRRGSIFDALTDLWGGSTDEYPPPQVASSEPACMDDARVEVLAVGHSEVSVLMPIISLAGCTDGAAVDSG